MLEKIKTCNNRCIFCFIDQLPAGLRSSLYFKDDDYLSSFQYGNFVTLTNLTKKDIKNIIKYRLEPLNVSLHSLDAKIRKRIFGNKNHIIAISNLKRLDSEGISTNIQIVLCPGINDKNDLDDTLVRLLDDYRNIISIGIVPVGITGFNKNEELRPVDKKYSIGFIERIDEIKKTYDISKKIFISDEFYIIAGESLPGIDFYGSFPQIQNGIGKVRDFLVRSAKMTDESIKDLENKKVKLSSKGIDRCLFITSEYGFIPLSNALENISKKLAKSGLKFPHHELQIVKNDFFGGNVKVTGLLSGRDIISKIRFLDIGIYDKIFIPSNIFNEDGLTVDGYELKNIRKFSRKIEILEEDLSDLFKKIILT